ncbi:MAG TPA: hypothetical protein VD902_06135 [Symbiobacteriaceae bacterium]|nr:hypothetical protein [Symbiobacteriaceae bacterium]
MMKNTFRKLIGILILGIFGVAIYRYVQVTATNSYVGEALAFGLKVLLFLALVLYLVYLYDRRLKKGQQ